MALIDALLLDPAPFNIWIAARTDGIKGSGTVNDPYDGSTAAKFDARMSEVGANTHVHLGPGTFDTAGFAETGGGPWQLKTGMKILGSGKEVTTICRVAGGNSGYVLSHDLTSAVDYFELSDLTLDCNLTGTPSGGATAGAIRVLGNHVRVARVRATNWGCSLSGGTCRVFAILTANPTSVPAVANCGIEGCIADAPKKLTVAPFNTGTVVMFHVGAPSWVGVQAEAYGLSPYLRNCFGQWDTSITGSEARGLSMNWCRGGAVDGNHIYDADYGGPYPGVGSTMDLVVRNNFFKNVKRGPFLNLGQLGATLLSPNTNGSLSVSSGVATISGGGLNVSTLAVGDRVNIVTTSPTTFTGVYQIASVQTSPSAQFTVRTSLTGPAAVTSVMKVLGVGRAIIEGNVIELAQVSGAIAVGVADNNAGSTYVEPPDYAHGDVIVRNNKIRYVDGAAPNDAGAKLIEVEGVKNLQVKDNVLDTIATAPLVNARCGNGTYFNNRTPAGALVRGLESTTGRKYDELETDAEDAFMLAILNDR